MSFELLPETQPTETLGQWRFETRGWNSQMEIAPSAVVGDTYNLAVGVEGREPGELRSDLGHILLEDVTRTKFVFDGASAQPPLFNPKLAAYPQFDQVEPFAISQHAVDGTRKFGFVTRWRLTNDLAGGSITRGTVVLALWVFDGSVADTALTDTARLRLVLPRVCSRTIVGATDGLGQTNNSRIKQYNDSLPGFVHPNQVFVSYDTVNYPDAPDFVRCPNPIIVSSNERFIYIWSTAADFTPIVIWYNSADTGATPLHFSSYFNFGWHWEPMGPQQPTDPVPPDFQVAANADAGWAYGGNPPKYYYKQTYRLWDLFRNRHTKIYPDAHDASGHLTDLQSIVTGFNRYNYTSAIDSKDVEIAMFYRYYELYSTLGSQREDILGTFYSLGTYRSQCHMTTDDLPGVLLWILNYSNANAKKIFATKNFVSAANSETGYANATTLIQMSDEGLAATFDPINPVDQQVYNPPQSYVLGAAHLQGVHFVASSVIQNVDQGSLSTPTTISSSNVVINYSDLESPAPEMFPAANQYVTKLDASKPFAFVACGDFMLAIGCGPMVRFRRNGTFMETIEFPSGLELVNAKAAMEVRGNLMLVAYSGVYEVDPSTGSIAPLGAVNRLVRDLWGNSLSAVVLGYDPMTDVVYIVNTTNKVAVKLWVTNQKITCLEDFPYKFLLPQVIGGARRLVMCSTQGRFVYPAHHLGEGYYNTVTMNGYQGRSTAFYNKPFNFVVTAKSGSTFTIANAALTFNEEQYLSTSNSNFDEYHIESSMYMLTGSYRGTRIPIVTTTTSSTSIIVTTDASTSWMAVGDYVSLSPVVFGLLGAPLEGSARGMSGSQLREVNAANVVMPSFITNGHAWALKAGYTEWAPGTNYPIFEVGVLDNPGVLRTEPQTGRYWFDRYYDTTSQERSCTLPDLAKSITYDQDDPSSMFGYFRGTGHILYPYVKSWVSNCVFRLKEWTVRGTIVPSELTL